MAYFSMEIALDPRMPTYAGGLGVLAGDTLRSAADLEVPLVALTLLHRKGYFRQHLDASGRQTESPDEWVPEERLEPLPFTIAVEIEGRQVQVRPWRFPLVGARGSTVDVYLLDTALEENSEFDRMLTDRLYAADPRYRLCQETLLGLGGVGLLHRLGFDSELIFHMNEGHSALLTLGLLEQRLGSDVAEVDDAQIEAVRNRCVFTTHTPVPAGHDQFPLDLVREVLGPRRTALLEASECLIDGTLNLTYVALRFSRYVNGVSMRHGEISLGMFPQYPITAITNGVHAATWTAEPFQALYDRWITDWRYDNRYLRYAIRIPLHEVQEAHRAAKADLLEEVNRRTGATLKENVMTLGFARRATPYKRAELLLSDTDRLSEIARNVGPIQIVYAGKAHPNDDAGKAMIRRIFEAGRQLGDPVSVVYLENYDISIARKLCAGVDLWVNTPRRPQEASGTSGMKAALNGVPSLSVLDGWWIEGHVEGVTGWSIPHGPCPPDDDSCEIASLYDKLARVILPLFYGQSPGFAVVMRSTAALNGAFFNTQRMVSQYVHNAYYPPRNAQPNALDVPDD